MLLLHLVYVHGQVCNGPFTNTFSNDGKAPTALHPVGKADIVIGTEGDWGEYNFIKDGVLGGFDIELVQGVCAEINKKCAIVTVPWQSVWPKKYTPFGWDDNSKTYPGEGHNHDWFHCSVGTRNMIARQQSVAFTHGYTDKGKDTAGFASKDAAFPADAAGKKVGTMAAFGTTIYYKAQLKAGAFKPSGTTYYDSMDKMWAALKSGTVDAAYVGETDAATWLKANSDYKVYHAAAGWSGGVAFGCSPERGDIVKLLNDGLTQFKSDAGYAKLCQKFPSIACDGCGAAGKSESVAFLSVATVAALFQL